jgi:Homeodomain-like domain-containing protein
MNKNKPSERAGDSGKLTPAKPRLQPKADREAIRMLAIELGAREAARRCGIPEATVCKWASRYKWNLPSRKTGRPRKYGVSILSTLPADVLLEELACHEKQTRLSLAQASSKLSEQLAVEPKLSDARNALDITRMSALLFGWKSEDPKVSISHSQVILTKADITELQALHRKALESAK